MLDLAEISKSQSIVSSSSESAGRKEIASQLIQQYRVNTLYGDFVFDIVPVEGENLRYLTVLSHYNLGEQIAMLYKSTGMMFILHSKLAHIVSTALNDFEYPVRKEKEVQ